jgi:hypothetical protein
VRIWKTPKDPSSNCPSTPGKEKLQLLDCRRGVCTPALQDLPYNGLCKVEFYNFFFNLVKNPKKNIPYSVVMIRNRRNVPFGLDTNWNVLLKPLCLFSQKTQSINLKIVNKIVPTIHAHPAISLGPR